MVQQGHRARRSLAIAGALGVSIALVTASLNPAHAAIRMRAVTQRFVGAGSTFVYPFFNLAFAEYSKTHAVSVNYQSIGSGGGIKQYIAGTVDFGASDVPMNAAELMQAGSNISRGGATVQIPVALGGEAITYNLPQLGKKTLKLDSTTLAGIFLGKITNWNDAALAKLNPSLKLPNESILPVHRSDGSGTTYIFTDYLTAVNSTWANNVGKAKSVAWPMGLGGKGNPGVATGVLQHPGAIGYVELAYALANKMTYAEVANQAGGFVFPNQATVRAAAAQFPKVSAQSFSIVNAPGRTSYPIAGYTWVMIRSHINTTVRRTALVDLFHWIIGAGQSYAGQLNYVPLPDNVVKVAEQALSQIQ